MGMRGSMMTCKVLLGDSLGAPRVYYRMDPVGPLTEVGRKCQLCIISSCFTYLFRLHISVDLTYLGLDVARLMSCSCFTISGSSGWWISGQLQQLCPSSRSMFIPPTVCASIFIYVYFVCFIALDCLGKKVLAHRDIECIMISSVLVCNYLPGDSCKRIIDCSALLGT